MKWKLSSFYTGLLFFFSFFYFNLSPPTYLSPCPGTCKGVPLQGEGEFSAVTQVSMPCCISQTRLPTRSFNESILFSLPYIMLQMVSASEKAGGRREGVFLRNTLKTLSLSFQSLHWAMKASGEPGGKKKINTTFTRNRKGGCLGFFFRLGLEIQTNWLKLCTGVNWCGISGSFVLSYEQESKCMYARLWGAVCAYWCAHAIGNTSLTAKVFLASLLPDLVRADITVGAGTGTAGSLRLPDKLQSDCTFLASTSTAPLSDGGIWDTATGHLQPSSSPLQAGLSLVSLFPFNRI